jgi:hypothetical protein
MILLLWVLHRQSSSQDFIQTLHRHPPCELLAEHIASSISSKHTLCMVFFVPITWHSWLEDKHHLLINTITWVMSTTFYFNQIKFGYPGTVHKKTLQSLHSSTLLHVMTSLPQFQWHTTEISLCYVMFAWTYQSDLSTVVQYFSLIT